MSDKLYDLKAAAAFLGIDMQYMRRLVLTGKIVSTKVPVKAGSSVMKHVIREEALVARKTAEHKAGGRADGRNKWTVYGTREEMAKVAALCAELGMEAPFMPNEGMYEKRKAAAAAAAAK